MDSSKPNWGTRMIKFSLGVTILMACLATVVLVMGLAGSQSAPQQAAAGAVAAALAVIPYVFTRCLQLDADRRRQEELLVEVVGLLEKMSQQNQATDDKANSPNHLKGSAPAVIRTDWR